MRKILLLLLASPVIFFGCKKKNFICTYPYEYVPISVAFKGYSSSELEKIIVIQYTANTSTVIAVDTFDGTLSYREGDNSYLSLTNNILRGYASADIGTDYKILLPAANMEYKISDIQKGAAQGSLIEETPCSMGSYQVHVEHLNATIAGGNFIISAPDVNRYFVYLMR